MENVALGVYGYARHSAELSGSEAQAHWADDISVTAISGDSSDISRQINPPDAIVQRVGHINIP